MKYPKPTIARNVSTGEERVIAVDPAVYTSVHQWKPVTPERFVQLLHGYSTDDVALDDFNHGLMSSMSYHLGRSAEVTIWYVPKEAGSPVSSPVLMTMTAPGGKTLCFSSTQFGVEAFA